DLDHLRLAAAARAHLAVEVELRAGAEPARHALRDGAALQHLELRLHRQRRLELQRADGDVRLLAAKRGERDRERERRADHSATFFTRSAASAMRALSAHSVRRTKPSPHAPKPVAGVATTPASTSSLDANSIDE